MLRSLIHALRKVSPWKGARYSCPGCGRTTIHTGPCAFCGTHVE